MEPQELMNDTKWDEIRLAMYNYPSIVFWRTKDLETGYISNWDGEWFYHFSSGGYKTIEWLDIKIENENMKLEIIKILKEIQVPGEVQKEYVRVYGNKKDGLIDYI